MTMTSDGNNGWTGARIGQDLREGDDSDPAKESPSYWWVPFVSDPKVLRGLLVMKTSYEREIMADHLGVDLREAPARLEETDLFRQIFRTSAGMSVDQALRQSDLDRQSAMIGLESSDDASGVSKLLRLIDRIEEGYIAYMFGQMGSGKTDFAVLISELWSRMQPEGAEIASNVESFERAETIKRYERLKDWVEEDRDRPQLFVFDEASSNASGYSQDAHKVQNRFRNLLQSFRKHRSNLLIIGHTGKDVHPHIRRQTNDCIEKESKKDAAIYESVEEGEGQNLRFEISGIEPAAWEYDTKEMSNWYWES
jgi:hypothetical protein